MRGSRFTREQIVGILKEHEASAATAALCRQHGISEQTFYRWKQKYVGLERGEATRLNTLEEENSALNGSSLSRRSTIRSCERPPPKKCMRPASQRAAVQWVRERNGVSERRACRLVGIGRSTLHYRQRGRAGDGPLRRRLRELAAERPRFGYRRLHVLRRREGVIINRKRVARFYRKEGLVVRRRRRKRVARDGRGRAALPGRPNQQ